MTTVVPAQPSDVAASVTPRTWAFINRYTGQPQAITCMQGCTMNHAPDMATPTAPEDIWCWAYPEDVTLPVNENGELEEFRVLSTIIKVEPWSAKLGERIPFAVVELVDDHYVDGLDPDGLATVIRTLSERLDQMRETHARLVAIRSEYMSRA
ncbi:DUF6907 domain-containing protein [Streptomyces aureus]|uniref:DUF6907 domain-containing protein n=1 Tax=Streptomyces aureus TaxID=193461 RepID=UPI00367BA3B2